MCCIFFSNQQRSVVTLEAWGLIDRGIFYCTTFNFKMFIFDVYKNLFDNCNCFALLQRMPNFLQYFDGNSPVIIRSQFIFKTKIMFMCMLVKIAHGFLFKCVIQWWPENTFLKHSCFSLTQCGWKFRFHSNKQKNDYLLW